jgi:O-acetyl-ADP-ribose deacetylase (regulator of RNase III)
MKCKFVIHAVGPMYHCYKPKHNHALLKAVTLNILETAKSLNASSVSIPAISSGIFGFPKEKCAEIMIENSL